MSRRKWVYIEVGPAILADLELVRQHNQKTSKELNDYYAENTQHKPAKSFKTDYTIDEIAAEVFHNGLMSWITSIGDQQQCSDTSGD